MTEIEMSPAEDQQGLALAAMVGELRSGLDAVQRGIRSSLPEESSGGIPQSSSPVPTEGWSIDRRPPTAAALSVVDRLLKVADAESPELRSAKRDGNLNAMGGESAATAPTG